MSVTSSKQAAASRPAIMPQLLHLLDLLPPAKQSEVLNFARFLHQQTRTTVPADAATGLTIDVRLVAPTNLVELTDLVALGGDAKADTEALYDNDAGLG